MRIRSGRTMFRSKPSSDHQHRQCRPQHHLPAQATLRRPMLRCPENLLRHCHRPDVSSATFNPRHPHRQRTLSSPPLPLHLLTRLGMSRQKAQIQGTGARARTALICKPSLPRPRLHLRSRRTMLLRHARPLHWPLLRDHSHLQFRRRNLIVAPSLHNHPSNASLKISGS